MCPEIIHDDNVSALQRGTEDLADEDPKHRAVGRTVNSHEGL
jgi:hypothetical protein